MVGANIVRPRRNIKKLFLRCSFRLSEKNEKDKKRKVLTPVSATPTHMLRICVNPSFKHLLSPRGDQREQSAPTVPLQHSHGYKLETLKRRLGFTAVPCWAMANLAVDIWVRKLGSLFADGNGERIFLFCLRLYLSFAW